ncbi:MAG: helix-turn-helix domain-containing protein [Syntrophales bacterium]
MNSLDSYPELMTVKQVAEYLQVSVSYVYRIKGLRTVRIGNRKGRFRIFKKDFIAYINACPEADEGGKDDSFKKERKREMGLSPLLPWNYVQEVRLQNEGRGNPRRSGACGQVAEGSNNNKLGYVSCGGGQ